MLELQNISKHFGTHAVLKDVSGTFPPGIHLFGGQNGSGKSTLFRIIAGLTRQTGGAIRFEPDDLRLLYVAHATFLYPGLTALENLAFWNRCYGNPLTEDELLLWLREFGLLPSADQYPRTFSRGMAQKLNLARAFMLQPRILLLDEPATGLDRSAQELLHTHIRRLKEKDCCVLLISHSIEEDSPSADTVHILEDGQLVRRK